MKTLRSHYFVVFLLRMLLLYLLYAVCRLFFAIYNWDIVGPIGGRDLFFILKGSFIFDSISIFYVNIPFVLFSLMPFRFREKKNYQRFLLVLFVTINSLGLIINISDIFYFPFKLSRIASEDLHFLTEGNFGTLTASFLKDYWGGLALWLLCVVVLWAGFRWLRYQPDRNRPMLHPLAFTISQTLLLGIVGLFMVFAIRGFSFSKASFPISMSDASLYVKPKYSSLVLSNPFCLIRTLGYSVPYPRYFEERELDTIYPVTHLPQDSVKISFEDTPNIILIILESFGTAHLKSFSDSFQKDDISYTPFLDSLARESYIFTNAYQNGLRSIDALPAIWASIPSFKSQFLSLPNSVSEYKALPACLSDMGYNTLFLHGAVRKSMSFVSFGQMAGVEEFYTREDYEAENGKGDFDGKWGIWDHKFLPFAAEKLSGTKEPFFATIFTLSSHHPFELPSGFEGRYPEGKMEIQRMIAYSDDALKNFFDKISAEEWFENTLFILTADHGARADNEKYLQMPYAYGVPIIFHYPGNKLSGETLLNGKLKGKDLKTTQHIDIMPTVLRMVGYDEEFFAFGRDIFNDTDAGFAINYYGSAFNYICDSMRYVFNERDVVAAYNYKEDYMGGNNKAELNDTDSLNLGRMKAFIQQYYFHLKERKFRVD